jgi:peptidyl-prolyl cis-trans isomerase C
MKTSLKAVIVGAVTIVALTQLPAEDASTKKEGASPAAETPKPKKESLFKDEVVVKGKGIEIKQSEIEEAYDVYKGHMASRGQRLPDDQAPVIEEKLAERLVITKILMDKATDKDKTEGDTSSEKLIADMRKRFPTEELFGQQLKATGMSLDEFKHRIREQSICEAVIEREVKGSIKVTDAEAKDFYEKNPERFERPEMVRAAHILLSTVDMTTQQPIPAAKKKEKEEQAKKLKERAEKGEDFGALAKEFSEDPGSKENGGEYTFPRGQMVKEFEAAAFSLKTNQVSDVVETQFGFHIIKLFEKKPAQKVEFAEVSEDLKTNLSQKQVQDQLPAYFEKIKKEYNVEFVKAAKKPEAAPVVPAPPASKAN